MGKPPEPAGPQTWQQLAEAFAQHDVAYVIIGKSGAILQGFPDTTQDIDLFPQKSPENGRKIVAALRAIGFALDATVEEAIIVGKDFVQLRGGPVDVDLVFAPDGLESYATTAKHGTRIEHIYPVASLADIIYSKEAAARQKDREVLPRLKAFAKYLQSRS